LDAQDEGPSIAINLSGRSISNPASFLKLSALLSRNRALAKRVLIEITETVELPDLTAADAAIQLLRNMGYRLGIDDFGSGAASLQYLHGLSVDFVKLDGKLIARLGNSQREDALVRSVLASCGELKVDTIAEWIDTPQKLKRCTEMGVRFGQGRQFGPPLLALPASAKPRGIQPRRHMG
jgi:EAL domain-containing protein (putative c-di-GMP-specific phosphodiesterase class I)